MTTKVAAVLTARCDLRSKRLNIGDYVLSKRVVVERKASGDFLQSIVDGRLFRQLSHMKKYEKPILIVEGSTHIMDSDRNIHPNAIRGAVASISTDSSVPIIWTQSQLDTAEMLLMIAKREQAGKDNAIALRTKKPLRTLVEAQEFIVAGLPKVSSKTARKLLMHFGSPQTVFSASDSELMKIPGIGEKMARKIRLIMAKKYDPKTAYKE